MRDDFYSKFWKCVIYFNLSKSQILNMDQHGSHSSELCERYLFPLQQGKYHQGNTQQQIEERLRYTVNLAISASGQLGYVCVTFKHDDKENDHKFGPIIKKKLISDSNCSRIWIQSSKSGLQTKECIKDMMMNCWGWSQQKRLFLLDSLSTWSADEQLMEIERECNCIVVTIPPAMTGFLQLL